MENINLVPFFLISIIIIGLIKIYHWRKLILKNIRTIIILVVASGLITFGVNLITFTIPVNQNCPILFTSYYDRIRGLFLPVVRDPETSKECVFFIRANFGL